ncbi:hypothetical protein DIE06_16815 [Burkholderia sp. Bp8998]|nr:hypothetical protein DIE06_16815 [Burkholderia sp. Bp8998]
MATFAMVLRVWCDLFIVKYSRDIYDDTLAVRSDFLAELRGRVSKVISISQVDAFMSMVDG